MSSSGLLGGFGVTSGGPARAPAGRNFGQVYSCALSLDRDGDGDRNGSSPDRAECSLSSLRGTQMSAVGRCSPSHYCANASWRSPWGSCAHGVSRTTADFRASSSSLWRPQLGSALLSSTDANFRWKFRERIFSDGAPVITRRMEVRAMGANPEEGKKALTSSSEFREAGHILLNKGNWHSGQYLATSRGDSDDSWEQFNMVLRVFYALAMYGGLAVAGTALCACTGVDTSGGFELSLETILQGLGYAVPPMMALLFILEDEIVKICPPARAIRDVEDEELIDFFVGMSTWQFITVVSAGALAEEVFFRVAIQGGLAHALQYTAKGVEDTTIGISALTSIIPFFTPFAQVCAALLTASLTGSMYYVISSPTDPTYVIAPGRNNRRDIKKRISAWYERRQLRKIYSPLMEALLALYLGFEWVQTGNILAPMITHILYSSVVVGTGLRRIHDNRERLRQRVSKVTQRSFVGGLDGESQPQSNLLADELDR